MLYFWTAPPGMRVGREALDRSRQRELERIHPDIVFNWPELVEAVEAARQQAAAVLTPEARREAWRGAGRPSKSSQRESVRSGAPGPVVTAPVAAPAPSQRPVDEPAVVTGAPAASTLVPTVTADEASNAAEPPAPRARRRRRRPRRSGDSSETPQPVDPIIES